MLANPQNYKEAIQHLPVEVASNHCPSNCHLLTGKNEFTSPDKANEMVPCHVANSRQSSVFYLSFWSGLCGTWDWDCITVLIQFIREEQASMYVTFFLTLVQWNKKHKKISSSNIYFYPLQQNQGAKIL